MQHVYLWSSRRVKPCDVDPHHRDGSIHVPPWNLGPYYVNSGFVQNHWNLHQKQQAITLEPRSFFLELHVHFRNNTSQKKLSQNESTTNFHIWWMIFSICDFVYPPVILPLKSWDIEFDEKHQTEEVGEFPQQKYLVYSKNYIKNESCYMYRE